MNDVRFEHRGVRASVHVALLSDVDHADVGSDSDPAAIPDPDRFVACIEDGVAEILAVA